MAFPMGKIFNCSLEIANSKGYNNIRMFKVDPEESGKEETDILRGWEKWETPDNSEKLANFSAVCFLFAR